MPSMNISVTPEILKFVQAKVESGMYNNASEVVREAIRQMDSITQTLEHMRIEYVRQALAEGLQQLKNGETESFTLSDILEELDGK